MAPRAKATEQDSLDHWAYTWPAPSEPGSKLYIAESLEPSAQVYLQQFGWTIVDVRTLPNGSDAERGEALKCWLEGTRMGTIPPDAKKVKFLELEATVYGLRNTKQASDKKKTSLDQLNADSLLDFGRGNLLNSANGPDAFSQPSSGKPTV